MPTSILGSNGDWWALNGQVESKIVEDIDFANPTRESDRTTFVKIFSISIEKQGSEAGGRMQREIVFF
ncbi:MAG: hypothetical protein F6K47_43130, partial [Symploca sp. SIO2E6]|nr:hypothetical protein [Symploca sp. SIO2E6]